MSPIDVNALFARAEAAYAAGRYDEARAGLAPVLRAAGEHPAVLHLLALVEVGAGRRDAARSAFRRALAKAPGDAQINNNYANLLDTVGDHAAALAHYDRAVAAAPAFVDARLNRATTYQKLGDYAAASADLDRLAAQAPGDARVCEARGAVRRLAGDRLGARDDFARALAIDPARSVALHGAARIALELSDDRAVTLYRAAAAARPGDAEIALGLAEALEAAGEAGGVELLAAAVAQAPAWTAGQDSLARMRSEAGEPDYAAAYAAAVARHPRDRGLALGYWRCLARGDRHADALAALDRTLPQLGTDGEIALMEAVFASETGDRERADRAFIRAGDNSQVALAKGRHLLRGGDASAAAALLEPVAFADLGLVTAWAHLALAWRLGGDPRFEWLCGQSGLWATQDLDIDADLLAELATVLRGLHRTKAHPIGQSLRGGTQTRGRLFDRSEPVLASLERQLDAAIAAHMAKLPPHDERHPLLRHRNSAFRIEGSWSVRLASAGFHVSHIHPLGVLSSAFYVALPTIGDDRAGWLEIGAPPVELGLGLPPLGLVEPQPGRLALFPSYFFHGTRPFTTGERLTVAFDVVV